MKERARKGGRVTSSRMGKAGISDNELGPLNTHSDAKRWLELIGRTVCSGRLSERAAQAGIRAVEAWLKAEGERVTMTVVEDLKAEVERLKTNMSGANRLGVHR